MVEGLDFMPIRIEMPDGLSRSIHLELRHGGYLVTIDGPAQAAHELGVLLQAWLQ